MLHRRFQTRPAVIARIIGTRTPTILCSIFFFMWRTLCVFCYDVFHQLAVSRRSRLNHTAEGYIIFINFELKPLPSVNNDRSNDFLAFLGFLFLFYRKLITIRTVCSGFIFKKYHSWVTSDRTFTSTIVFW